MPHQERRYYDVPWYVPTAQLPPTVDNIPRYSLHSWSWVLLIICTLDLVTSAVLFHLRWAVEANPLLSWSVEQGVGVFVLIKAVSFLIPILVAEYIRRRQFHMNVGRWLRATSVLYVVIYLVSSGWLFAFG